MSVINEFEAGLISALKQILPFSWKSVALDIDMGDGSFSPSGSIEKSFGRSLFFGEINTPAEFSQAIFKLGDASRSLRDGSIYHVAVIWRRGGTPSFRYRHQERDVTSLAQVKRDIHGMLPMFMFKQSLNASLLKELRPREVIHALQTYAHANRSAGSVSDRVLAIVAISEWLGGVCRGGSDSYFLQYPMDAGSTSVQLIRTIRRGLTELKRDELSALFDESLRIYASEVDAAMQICREAGLEPLPVPASQNDDDVNRVTKAVQKADLAWAEQIGLWVQSNVTLYATS